MRTSLNQYFILKHKNFICAVFVFSIPPASTDIRGKLQIILEGIKHKLRDLQCKQILNKSQT